MNDANIPACKLGHRLGPMLATSVLAALVPAFSIFADDEVGDQTILATVNVPAQNLPCDQAAAQSSVSFQALNIPFEVRRISVFIDGAGLPESAVEEAWPSVVVDEGLHAGRNLVEFILYGPDNQSMDRKQTVLIGAPPNDGDVAPAQVYCIGDVAADDEVAAPALAVDDSAAPANEAPPFYDQDPAYAEGPVYSYYPAPIFFGPVYSVGYFSPPPVYYWPRTPLFYNGHQGNGHGHSHTPDRGRNGGVRSSVPAFGDGASDGAGTGHPGLTTPPAAHHGTFNTYSPPSYERNDAPADTHTTAEPTPQNNSGPHYGISPPAAQHGFNPPVYGSRPQTQNPPRELPPPSRQLAPPPQMPLPTQRFNGPPPQVQRGGIANQPQPRR